MGHAIDYYAGIEKGTGGFYSDTFTTNGSTLADYNKTDVLNSLNLSIDDILRTDEYAELSAAEREKIKEIIIDHLTDPTSKNSDLSKREQEVLNKLIVHYADEFDGPDPESASDVFGGVTNLKITGDYGHFGKNSNGDTYWFESNGDVIREPNKESFAEYYGRIMVDGEPHTDGIESIENNLPQSKQHMDEMFQSLG
jgi:hypothetical protein